MSRRDWLLSVIGWDAGLPLVVASSFVVLPELVAVILVPILAAVFRAHHARRQLVRRGIKVTLVRQLLFGCSLIALLLFESLSGILHFARGVPPYVWLAAGVLYLVYLCLVALALRPKCWAIA